MTAKECIDRARVCRQEAARSWGKLKEDFLAAAEQWETMAQRLEAEADEMKHKGS